MLVRILVEILNIIYFLNIFVYFSHIEGYVNWLYKTDYDKRTVLHVAAADGHAHIVSYLMEHHVDLNVKDRYIYASFNLLYATYMYNIKLSLVR